MDTPLYDELVVKYYLSQNVVPFSYPHKALVGEVKVKVSAPRGPVDPTTRITYDLISNDKVVGTYTEPVKYDYFRL